MAYNNRYIGGGKGTDTEVTDIHGRSTNPYIQAISGGSNSRTNSPVKSDPFGKGAEILSSDVVYSNEKKVRNQISFLNKEGVIGPFVGMKDSGPVPKSPQIPMGSSSYNMHFSPAKKRDELPTKLMETSPIVNSMSSSMGLRHLSNGDAFHKSNILSSSIDYSSRGGKYGVIQGQNVSYDKRNDDFRFKKNLTSNADRILGSSSSASMTPKGVGSSKYEEIKRSSNELFSGSFDSKDNSGFMKAKTYGVKAGKENLNQDNIKSSPIQKMFMKEPAGGYNAASMKRSLGISPTAEVDLTRLVDSPPRYEFGTRGKAGVNSDNRISNAIYRKGKSCKNNFYLGVRREGTNIIL